MNQVSPKKQFFSTVLAGSIGAIVGASVSGLISLKANRAEFDRTVSDREHVAIKNERALLQVLEGDLKAIRILHSQANGLLRQLPEGKPFFTFVPVTLNYFSVFENNVFQLGAINDPDLRAKIIFVYQKAKSLIDTLRRNNEVVGDYKNWDVENRRHPSAVAKEMMSERRDYLVKYAVLMKATSDELAAEIDSTLTMIESYLAKPR